MSSFSLCLIVFSGLAIAYQNKYMVNMEYIDRVKIVVLFHYFRLFCPQYLSLYFVLVILLMKNGVFLFLYLVQLFKVSNL